jgi:hypothetical protein
MTDYYEDDETVINAEFIEKKPPKKEPGLFQKFAAYRKKNLEANRKAGEPALEDELKNMGMDWGKSFSKGMAEVGREEEAKLMGKTKSSSTGLGNADDSADEFLFGKKKGQPTATQGGTRSPIYTEKEFIDKLCEFLRYVAEDDDVGMYQHRGTQYIEVDYKYLSKLLTRYLGHKVTLKERDLMFK